VIPERLAQRLGSLWTSGSTEALEQAALMRQDEQIAEQDHRELAALRAKVDAAIAGAHL
jgi:hypothetical protein